MQDEKLVEAILFAAGNRISVDRIVELSGLTKNKVEKALQKLLDRYADSDSTFMLTQMGNEWKFTVQREFLPIVEKIAPDTELTKTVIETLAIIAWKSPVSQSDIVKIRGNKSYDHISELQDKGFIEKQKDGRTFTIKITSKFFEYFDIDKSQITQMFEKFDGKEEVKEEEITDAEKAEEERREAQIAALDDHPTFDEIKAEENKDQKEFFDNIEGQISASTARTDEIVGEIAKLRPDVPEEGQMSEEDVVALENAEEGVKRVVSQEHEEQPEDAELEAQTSEDEDLTDSEKKKEA